MLGVEESVEIQVNVTKIVHKEERPKDMKKEMDSVQDLETYNRVQELMKND